MILAIDTALAATSACLWAPGDAVAVAAETLPMQGGHAEALLPLIDRIVARSVGGFASITRVAVSIGPGSFTGIRIGVAAGRAIAIACKVPVVGVATLPALAAPAIMSGLRPPIIAAIDARHGNIFVQSFGASGETLFGPFLLPASEAASGLGSGPLHVVGSGGAQLAVAARSLGVGVEVDENSAVPDIVVVARLGAVADPEHARPRPLYLKAPEAKPAPAASLLRAT